MTIKAIVFDIGGVLIRTDDRTCREKLEKQYHLPPGGADQLVFNSKAAKRSTMGQATADAVWENVKQSLNLTPESLKAFQKAFWKGDRLDQSLLDALQGFRKTCFFALLTNAWTDMRAFLAEKFNLREGVSADRIFISSELGMAKPDPAIYRHLAREINLAPHEILFVDDFIENIESAAKLGIHTIHFQPGMDVIEIIREKTASEV